MKRPTNIEVLTASCTAGFISVTIWPDNISAQMLFGVPVALALIYLIFKLKNDNRRFQ